MKLKIYKIIFSVLIIAAIIVFGLIIIKYAGNHFQDLEAKKVVETFSNSISKNQEQDVKEEIYMEGYKVIGTIKISKINIEYPILDVPDADPTKTIEPMNISIVKYWGGNVNDYGNLSIAGHNRWDGTMFGKAKDLKIGDIVELTDLQNITIQYEIYEISVTDPNDVSILLTEDESIREVTLITCTNGNKNRRVLKAKQI